MSIFRPGIKEYLTDELIGGYRKRLKAQGYKVLGSGVYAFVYCHPSRPDEVMKVGILDEKPEHDGWLQYALASMDVMDNPWLPDVKELRICEYPPKVKKERGGWGFYVARIERLQKLHHVKSGRIAREISAAIDAIIDGEEDADINDIICKHIPIIVQVEKKLVGDPELIEAIEIIMNILRESHRHCIFETDLHHGNIMMRTNGQFVIVDPLQ